MYNTDMPTRAELPSTGKLVRSTAIAAVTATAILIAVVLPAEYGIDPTGVGSALNLTEMGEIKTQLAAEAEADAARDAAARAAPATGADATPLPPAAVGVVPPPVAPLAPPAPPAPPAPERQSSLFGAIGSLFVSSAVAQEMRQDEMTITLAPGEGAEIKLTMQEGEIASFAWVVSEGGAVNYDTHGDGGGQNISYEKGRSVSSDEGTIQAAFTGNHGWFWRNRGDAPVSLTLRTSGTYTAFDRKV
ncbi:MULTISPECIES: hypothetical protein [Aurantimonas]|uniref:hypothetical protein n=1 Tax=Aurantimonas TaxID=182269 RepID=UPI001E361899|nr:hypothetical protein [Aurantimonas coralicida]MCD1645134.1 hypothetical protein [Aurantimonas coralicida]MCW7544849.1 hypothetical protein [Aurantimonas litoralis]